MLPRPGAVEDIRKLLGAGGDDAISRPAQRLPTEGTFRIRTYVPGDDARRIHWVRSLQQNQLVVRLPDEIPPAEPAVRLILDNALRGIEQLTCRAPDELLDALVQVWLGIGKSLAEAGTRVTLVTAADKGGVVVPVERTPSARSSREALRLGARVAWQPDQPLAALLTDTATKQIVVSDLERTADVEREVRELVAQSLGEPIEGPSAVSSAGSSIADVTSVVEIGHAPSVAELVLRGMSYDGALRGRAMYGRPMRRMMLTAVCLVLGLGGCRSKRERNDPLVAAAKACTYDSELSCPRPILNVASLQASQRYYRDALGFTVDWEHGDPPDFGSVSRGDSVFFLCQGCQGMPGAWTMIFTRNVDRLHDEFVRRKAIIKMPPTNMPWGMREMQVADPDGNVMRFGRSIEE